MQANETGAEVAYNLTPDDYKIYYRFLFARQVPHYVQVGLPILLLIPVIYVLLKGENPLTTPTSVMGIALIIVLWIGKREALQAANRRPQNTGQRTLRIGQTGVQQEVDGSREDISWSGISQVIITEEHIYLFLTHHTAFVIPLGAFSGTDSAHAFYQKALTLWKDNR